MRIAYIVSSSFSGSTLLSMILNAHPQVATISEFDRMDAVAADPDFRCSCGERLRECGYFREVARLMAQRGHEFRVDDMDLMLRLHPDRRLNTLLTRRLPRLQSSALEHIRDRIVEAIPSYRREMARFLERTDAFMDVVTKLKGASVFLDANKNPFRMRLLARYHDVRPIYLFKNGVAGVYSYVKNAREGARSANVARASERWFTEQITIGRLLEEMDPERTLRLSYSDFCADVPSAVERICDLLEIERRTLDDFSDAEHHIIGNRMRLGGVGQIRERTDWKERMSEDDIAVYRKTFERYERRLRRANPAIVDHIWR